MKNIMNESLATVHKHSNEIKNNEKNLLRKNLKLIIIIAAAVILCSSLSVFAYSYFAKDIGYTKMDGSKVNVEEALNSLYNMKGGGASNVINNFSPKVDVTGLYLVTTCDATTNDNSQIKGYIYIINGEVAGISTDNKYTYTNLKASTEYKISVVAIDNNGNTKMSDTINAKTAEGLYLYKDGNKYEDITGGWQLTKDYNSYSDITSYNYLLMYSKEVGNRGSALSSKKAVDLTSYSKLKMLINKESTGSYPSFRFGTKSTPITGVAWNAFTNNDNSKVITENGNNMVVELDISNLKGSYYIGADVITVKVEIHSIWLE